MSMATVIPMILLLLLFAKCIKPINTLKSTWTEAARQSMVDIHNDFRGFQDGCRMNKLVYDLDLEKKAKGFAEKCMFDEDPSNGGFGVNTLYNTTTTVPEVELVENAFKSWVYQKYKFRYRTRCYVEGFCEINQVVWAKTEAIGCYSTICPVLVKMEGPPILNTWYVVCFYDPKGNLRDQEPFMRLCDNKCWKEQTEEDGLCVGTPPCFDGKYDCDFYKLNGKCETDPEFMEMHCIKSCGWCDRKNRGGWVNRTKLMSQMNRGGKKINDKIAILLGFIMTTLLMANF